MLPDYCTVLNAALVLLGSAVVYVYYNYFRLPGHLIGLKGWTPFQSVYYLIYQKWSMFETHRTMLNLAPPQGSQDEGIFRFWIAGYITVVYKPELVKQILTDHKTFGKSESLRNTDFGKWIGDNMLMANGEQWRTQRKVATPAFHHDNLRDIPMSCKDIVVRTGDKLGTGEAVDVSELMSRMTLDILGVTAFGYDFDSVNHPDQRFVELYKNILRNVIKPSRFMAGRFAKYMSADRDATLHQEMKEFDDFIYGIIKKKKTEDKPEGSPLDLLDMMLSANKEDDVMTDVQLRDNMVTFFLAGHDTTASALAYVLWHLAYFPDIQRKVQAEIDAVLGPVDCPTYEMQSDLVYTTMVIKESMRRIPSVNGVVRETKEDVSLGGRVLKKGTNLNVSIVGSHWNPTVWSDPGAFNPDRFDPKVIADEKRHPFAHVPFIAGPRVCIGNNFSMVEQRLFLGTTLKRFNVKPADPTSNVDSLRFRQGVLSSALNCHLVFTPR